MSCLIMSSLICSSVFSNASPTLNVKGANFPARSSHHHASFSFTLRLSAWYAAWFTSAAQSAPTKPWHPFDSSSTSASVSSCATSRSLMAKISRRDAGVGTPTSISLSNLPGLRRARSIASGLFVVATTTTRCRSRFSADTPSRMERSVVTTRLDMASSSPPPFAPPVTPSPPRRAGAMESISSIITTHGLVRTASLKTPRNAASDSPTTGPMSSGPRTTRRLAPAAAAAAREGLSSVRGVFEDLRGDGEPIRLTPASSIDDASSPPSSSSLSRRRNVTHAASPELARARAALREFRADMDASGVAFTPQCATALVQTMGRLREFDEMMAFVRSPPPGVPPDVYMYTQALHALAQDPFHWRRDGASGDEGNDGSDDVRDASRRVETGPEAALQLADEMTSLGVAHTRVTLNCVLLACAHLRDYDEAIRRFETHVNGGGEVGVDTYNALLRCAWAAGVFAQNASSIARALEDEGLKPNAHTELTLRRCGGFGQGMGGDRDASDALLRRFGFAVEAPAVPPIEPMPWEKDDENEKTTTSSSAYEGPPPRKPLVAEIGIDVEDDDDVDELAEGDMEEPLVYSRKDGKLTRAGRRWEKGRK
mmetsp:Transcript_3752/g.14037  ORF Transcript_3752/g.14037 Transcript_3752/m.14037 type:complete len:597 (-) Transcript_3752:49-1839(-)